MFSLKYVLVYNDKEEVETFEMSNQKHRKIFPLVSFLLLPELQHQQMSEVDSCHTPHTSSLQDVQWDSGEPGIHSE